MKFYVIYPTLNGQVEYEAFEKLINAETREAELMSTQGIRARIIAGIDISTELARAAFKQELAALEASQGYTVDEVMAIDNEIATIESEDLEGNDPILSDDFDGPSEIQTIPQEDTTLVENKD